MHTFSKLQTAASYAMRSIKPMFVFHGPENNYVVAMGRDARELMNDDHVPLTLSEIASAAR